MRLTTYRLPTGAIARSDGSAVAAQDWEAMIDAFNL
jgi:hypothetical protein